MMHAQIEGEGGDALRASTWMNYIVQNILDEVQYL
jgi:hypothetical protein